MIPYSLQFSGIRDYRPTKISFGSESEHVLIAGPNGAGKSTITFAIGAALYSSQVDIEGLRSANLPPDQPWHAEVFLTFHNTGLSQIDAPSYVGFQLLIQQKPGNVIQRQYAVYTGEFPEEMELTTTYRSGDIQKSNLSKYREDLQYKYQIHPDVFYLIWYQNEVNQFAAMSPEERFRRFSEMYHIEEMQREWEASVESFKQIEADFKLTIGNLKLIESQLKMAEDAYKHFSNNKKTLKKNGEKNVWLMHCIREKLRVEKNRHEEDIAIKERYINGLVEKREIMQQQLAELKDRKTLKQQQLNEAEQYIQQLKNSEKKLNQKNEVIKKQIQRLQEKLKDTEQLRKKMMYTEEEIVVEMDKCKIREKQLTKDIDSFVHEKRLHSRTINDLQYRKVQEELSIQSLDEREDDYQNILSLYISSHQVEVKLLENKKEYNDLAKELPRIEEAETMLTEEIKLLKQDKMLSRRQLDAISTLRKQGITAYTLRDLVELDERATLKDEIVLDPIKYTIFYMARTCQPANDLYHVPLPSIIPTKFIDSLPTIKLKIKKGLKEQEVILASKVLFWVDQFLQTTPLLKMNGIEDARGVRGSQEKNTFILSTRSSEERLILLQKRFENNQQKKLEIKVNLAKYEKEIGDLQSVLKDVKKAEAFNLELDQRNDKVKLIAEINKQLEEQQKQSEDVQEKIIHLQQEFAFVVHRMQFLEQQLDIYSRIGELKEEQQQLTNLEQEERDILDKLNLIRASKEEYYVKVQSLHDFTRDFNRNIRDLGFDIDDNKREMTNVEKDRTHLEEKIEANQAEITRYEILLQELKHLIPDLYEIAMQKQIDTSQSMPILLSENEKARVAFENARKGEVDPQAEENYKKRKEEYEKKQSDAALMEELVEEKRLLLVNKEDKLDTTVHGLVEALNKKFQTYMSLFNFESEIMWERYEDKRGRAIFKLYVKAHKAGHGRRLEDVSVKARNGKYGKGVSGGEESLSSLLFALTLLQHLDTTPGYIILDEFDSALDENRKEKVFELYARELERKLIILSPKAHDDRYYEKYSKVFIVQHNAVKVESAIKGIQLVK